MVCARMASLKTTAMAPNPPHHRETETEMEMVPSETEMETATGAAWVPYREPSLPA